MAKRIIKETTSTGCIKYRVETNDGLFGIRKKFNIWVPCTFSYDDNEYDAVFPTLSEAEQFCLETDDKIVFRETIKIYGD